MPKTFPAVDPADFIRSHLPRLEVPGLGGIVLHTATPRSGLGSYVAAHNGGRSPYWAFPWSGGLALAHHLVAHPDLVAGKRILDLGAGGGVVGITAARTGAASVLAAETDPLAVTALGLNAAANGVELEIVETDLLDGTAPDVDLICAGDLFYHEALAARATAAFTRWQTGVSLILVGDPGRPALPLARLTLLASYELDIGGFGESSASVYRFGPPPRLSRR